MVVLHSSVENYNPRSGDSAGGTAGHAFLLVALFVAVGLLASGAVAGEQAAVNGTEARTVAETETGAEAGTEMVAETGTEAVAEERRTAASPDATNETPSRDGRRASSSNATVRAAGSGNGTAERITLISGHTVVVTGRDGAETYRLAGNGSASVYRTDAGTYVVPDGVDLARFDRELFDVDLLRRQNVTDEGSASIPVIVETRSRTGRVHAQDGSASDVLRRTHTLESIGAVAGEVRKDRARRAFRDLSTDDRVESVHYDAKVRAADTGDPAPNALRTVRGHEARERYNVSGAGVTVAILDSGVDETHPAIEGSEVRERDFTEENTTSDVAGHGTHVAGIVTGEHRTANGSYVGVAPNASIVDVRVLDSTGYGRESDVIDGLDYAVERDVDVVTASLGFYPSNARRNDPLHGAIRAANDENVTVVAAAGNRGRYRSVTSPGIHEGAITVGASANGSAIAERSSRGPTPVGSYVKPDLVAPGVAVTGPDAGTSRYRARNGSSYAAPMVSGTVALLSQRYPERRPATLRSAVVTTADPVEGADVYSQGAGVLDASAALETEVAVTPSTIDFGRVEPGSNATATVTIRNHGTETKTLPLSATARLIDGGGSGSVSLDRSSVTLGPDESATVAVTVDAATGPNGVYSGRLSVGPNHTAIFGYERDRRITVEKRGASVATDEVVLIDEDRNRTYGPRVLENGTATFDVGAAGNYTAVSTGRTDGQPVVTVNGTNSADATRLVLDETETVERGIDASTLSADASRVHNRTVRVNVTAGQGGYDTRVVADDASTAAVRVSPGADATYAVRRVLAVEPAGPAYDAPALYHLEHVAENVTGPRERSIDRSRLRTLRVRYYRGSPDETYSATLGAANFDDVPLRETYASAGVGARHEQTVYVSPSLDHYHDAYATGDDGAITWSATPEDVVVDFAETGATTVAVRKQPLRSKATDWSLNRTAFSATVFPTVGQAPNGFVVSDPESERYDLWVNGTRVRSVTGSRVAFPLAYRGDDVSSVRLRVQDRRGLSHLANRTTTTFLAHANGTDTAPPAVPDVSFEGLSATNAVPSETVELTVAADDRQGEVDAVSAYVAETDVNETPFDGSGAWREVALVETADGEYVAELNESGFRGTLSVAVRAEDAAGNAVETTAYDAVVVGDRRPLATGTVDTSTAIRNETAVTFDATAASDDASIAAYAWDFDGDGTVDAETTGPTTSHVYESAGTYRPRLRVVDVDGYANGTALPRVTVRGGSGPSPSVSVENASVAANETVTLEARIENGWTDGPRNDSADGSTNGSIDYRWSQTAGPDAEFLARNGSSVTVRVPDVSERTALTFRVNAITGSGATATDTATVTVEGDADLPPVGAAPPRDPDGDDRYEDVNGNGEVDYDDVVALFANLADPTVTGHVEAYDYNGNQMVDFDDVVALFESL